MEIENSFFHKMGNNDPFGTFNEKSLGINLVKLFPCKYPDNRFYINEFFVTKLKLKIGEKNYISSFLSVTDIGNFSVYSL